MSKTAGAGRNAFPQPELSRVSRLRIALACTAVMLAAACFVVFDPAEAVIGAAGCAVLAAVTATDLERRIVPNRIVVPATVLVLLAQTLREPGLEWVLACLAAGVRSSSPRWRIRPGWGWATSSSPPSWARGSAGTSSQRCSWASAALVPSVVILLKHGRAGRKMGIPFAPFLALGGVVALFAGEPLLDWYLGIGG